MKTLRLSSFQIDEAAALLRSGEPIAIPTETVYGLSAPIFDVDTIEKIFGLKGRPKDNPLIAHVSSLDMVQTIAENLPVLFFSLAKHFWPGPLTMILPKKKEVPLVASGGLSSIGVRMPSHPIALALIEKMNVPLVAPSANLSGKPSPTSAQHVIDDFDGRLAAVLEGGDCLFGIESTVLSLVHKIPTILRPGAISKQELEAVLGQKICSAQPSDAPLSPGMKYRHYAPKAKIRLCDRLPEGAAAPFLLSREQSGLSPHRPLQPHSLYRYLREADQIGVEEIWILIDPISSGDEALMNRLLRAAGLL